MGEIHDRGNTRAMRPASWDKRKNLKAFRGFDCPNGEPPSPKCRGRVRGEKAVAATKGRSVKGN